MSIRRRRNGERLSSLWQMACNGVAALFGVQRNRDGNRYAKNGNVPLIIVVGYALTFLIAAIIYVAARFVLARIGT